MNVPKKNLPAFRRHAKPMLNWPFMVWNSRGSTLGNSTSYSIASEEYNAYFNSLYLRSCLFDQDPDFMTVGEGRNVDR